MFLFLNVVLYYFLQNVRMVTTVTDVYMCVATVQVLPRAITSTVVVQLDVYLVILEICAMQVRKYVYVLLSIQDKKTVVILIHSSSIVEKTMSYL